MDIDKLRRLEAIATAQALAATSDSTEDWCHWNNRADTLRSGIDLSNDDISRIETMRVAKISEYTLG